MKVDGVVFERPAGAQGWAAASSRCCSIAYEVLRAPTIPILVGPGFADPTPVVVTGTVGTTLSRSFTATGTPIPAVTVIDAAKLPPGTAFANDPVTGDPTLSGTPTAAGSYTFRLAADNGVGTPVHIEATVTGESSPTGSLGSLGSIFGS